MCEIRKLRTFLLIVLYFQDMQYTGPKCHRASSEKNSIPSIPVLHQQFTSCQFSRVRLKLTSRREVPDRYSKSPPAHIMCILRESKYTTIGSSTLSNAPKMADTKCGLIIIAGETSIIFVDES